MNSEIQLFKHEMFGEIRTMTDEKGESWFVGRDVAEALGYKNPSNSLQIHVDEEDKTTYLIQVSGMNFKSKTVFINESGLYALVLSSKLPSAKLPPMPSRIVTPSVRSSASMRAAIAFLLATITTIPKRDSGFAFNGYMLFMGILESKETLMTLMTLSQKTL